MWRGGDKERDETKELDQSSEKGQWDSVVYVDWKKPNFLMKNLKTFTENVVFWHTHVVEVKNFDLWVWGCKRPFQLVREKNLPFSRTFFLPPTPLLYCPALPSQAHPWSLSSFCEALPIFLLVPIASRLHDLAHNSFHLRHQRFATISLSTTILRRITHTPSSSNEVPASSFHCSFAFGRLPSPLKVTFHISFLFHSWARPPPRSSLAFWFPPLVVLLQ